MKSILAGCGIELSREQNRLLWQYHRLVRRFNPEINLTRIYSFENMVLKLYADSIMPALLTEIPSPLLDIGTGPGMPGIPLKIFKPELHVILSETRGKRNDFLHTVIQSLGLEGIEVLGKGMYPGTRVQVSGIITRAVEEIPETLARIQGSLAREGLAIFMKGPDCDREISAAVEDYSKEYKLINDRAYIIPGTPHDRRLVIFRRISDPVWQVNLNIASKIRITQIESEKNETYRVLVKILGGKGAKKAGKTLVSGSRQVNDVLNSLPAQCEAWITRGDLQAPPSDCPEHLNWLQMAPELFRTLDIFGTDSPLLLVRTPEIEEWKAEQPLPEGCTLFIPFQDPENVGAVIRSAVAFRVSGIVLLEGSASPFHPKAVRSSGGAVFHAKLFRGPSISELPANLPILPLSAEGKNIRDVKFPHRFGLLAGLEGPGIPEKYRSSALAVPIAPEVESLNAALATGIALYAWSSSLP
ncbi:MAG: 16S rRNA (guanine(527)-N(7))-methyltransferase RsmG [Desulfococcaceae bacterium]